MEKNGRKVLYKNIEYNNVKEIIDDVVVKYSDCTAFTIKNKIEKEVNYRYITYKEFGEEINALRNSINKYGT